MMILRRRGDEAAARDLAAACRCTRSLGWKWPEISGRGSSRTASWRRMIPPTSTSSAMRPPQWSAKPGSWLPTIQVQSRRDGERGQQRARAGRQPVAAEAVVEAVAEAIEARRAGALDLAGERGQRRVRIIGRQELAEPREPARLFEVQVGDEQRLLRGPDRARRRRVAANVSPANEKGTMSQL